MDIKNLELTERDFQLLIEGLDSLPEKGMAGEIMSELIMGMVTKGDKDSPEYLEQKRKQDLERRKKQLEKDAIKDDIKILQGKLLMFKRYLIQNNALKEVDEILNH